MLDARLANLLRSSPLIPHPPHPARSCLGRFLPPQRLAMEKEEHALRMAIGKSALALLNKMAGEPPLPLSPPMAPVAPPPQPQPHDEPAAGPM